MKKQEEARQELCILHPSGLLVYRDGRVLVPSSGKHPAHFTYGTDNGDGYKKVSYQGKMHRVHRLVAECFLQNPDNKPTVDHINQRRDENQVENLRWATRAEQQNFKDQDVRERAVKNTDYKAIAKKNTNGRCSRPVLQCDLDGNVVRMWPSTQECGRNGYSQGRVSDCCNNKYIREGNNIYKGFVWKYKEEAV